MIFGGVEARSGVGGIGRRTLAGVHDLAADPLTREADFANDVHLLFAVVERAKDFGHQLIVSFFGGLDAALVSGGETAKPLLAVLIHGSMFAHGVRHQGMAVSHAPSIAKRVGH